MNLNRKKLEGTQLVHFYKQSRRTPFRRWKIGNEFILWELNLEIMRYSNMHVNEDDEVIPYETKRRKVNRDDKSHNKEVEEKTLYL